MQPRIVFMGTPDFAVASLDAVSRAGYEIAAVVTVPDRKVGRGQKIAFSPVKEYAMAHGINYYDTAWGYHNGNSELVVGKMLKNYPRENFYVATKFPGYDLSNFGKHEEIFKKQLEKLQMDHVDFYLLHNNYYYFFLLKNCIHFLLEIL